MSDHTRLTAALADRYRIERELGQGGMATVWLAEDLRHQRKVAIKVLRPELAAVLGAERFVQEITTTAQLQHPHILPLFDSGTAGRQDGGIAFLYYVMPYIEGETLRSKLDREKQLGIDEAVKIAREVADALDYAHRHGVIHRDIKPENILLHDGRPMVADFGIALAVSAAAGGRMTETGLSLGTPHYMSPEQATADRDITARSDIYSLASVLYEMLAGEPPHLGNSAQQIIMKIVTDVARPVTELRKSTPPHVADALAVALEKLPADRFATARDFADALDGTAPGATVRRTTLRAGAPPVASVAKHPLVLALAAALVLAVAFGVFALNSARGRQPAAVVRFHVDLPPDQRVASLATGANVAVSRDGTMFAFILVGESGIPHIHVQGLADGVARPVAGTDGALVPCFSPSGEWIAYLRGIDIWKVRVEGGAPVLVGSLGIAPIGIAWTESNEIVAGTSQRLAALPANGGEARTLAVPDTAAGERYLMNPLVLPGDEAVLFAIQSSGGMSSAELASVPLAGGTVRRHGVSSLVPLGYVDGNLILVTPTGALTALPFDAAAGRATGEPVALGPTVLASTAGGSAAAALSPSGTLIYQSYSLEGTIGWVDAQGRFTELIHEPRRYAHPRLSPDGRRMAYAVGIGSRSEIWVSNTAGAEPTQLQSAGLFNDRPDWTHDNRRVLYRSERGGRSVIAWQPFDLSAPESVLLEHPAHDYFEAVLTPDDRRAVYQVDDGGERQADVMQQGLDGDTVPRPVAITRFNEAQPRLSPDGRWVAYVSDERDIARVFVQPFPGPGTRVQVSVAGGQEPVWSRDGRRLYYRDGLHMVAATVTTGAGFAVTGRTELFNDVYRLMDAPHANYDVAADGRFLMIRSSEESRVLVVYHWTDELRSRLQDGGAR